MLQELTKDLYQKQVVAWSECKHGGILHSTFLSLSFLPSLSALDQPQIVAWFAKLRKQCPRGTGTADSAVVALGVAEPGALGALGALGVRRKPGEGAAGGTGVAAGVADIAGVVGMAAGTGAAGGAVVGTAGAVVGTAASGLGNGTKMLTFHDFSDLANFWK